MALVKSFESESLTENNLCHPADSIASQKNDFDSSGFEMRWLLLGLKPRLSWKPPGSRSGSTQPSEVLIPLSSEASCFGTTAPSRQGHPYLTV